MKKLIIVFAIASGTLLLAQCTPKAGKAVSETHTTTTNEPVAAHFSAEQLAAGKVLFTGSCIKCHGLKAPETRTQEQWEKVLKRMIPKAKLNEGEGKLVRAYLMANAKQG